MPAPRPVTIKVDDHVNAQLAAETEVKRPLHVGLQTQDVTDGQRNPADGRRQSVRAGLHRDTESQRVELAFIVRASDAGVSHEVHMPDDQAQNAG